MSSRWGLRPGPQRLERDTLLPGIGQPASPPPRDMTPKRVDRAAIKARRKAAVQRRKGK